MATGKTYKRIAEELHVSVPTIKTHASNVYKKCGVTGRHELTVLLTS
ncbi:MAG: response regulator transcription factor [Granulosicoccus sp.]